MVIHRHGGPAPVFGPRNPTFAPASATHCSMSEYQNFSLPMMRKATPLSVGHACFACPSWSHSSHRMRSGRCGADTTTSDPNIECRMCRRVMSSRVVVIDRGIIVITICGCFNPR